ncbi:MAG: DNA-binding protein [Actinomycetia bacterium]|nr:DNA-binding protein [Actinomycetes bacterium]
MSEDTQNAYRVLSLRVDDNLRAQLEVLAQLNDRSVTEECRIALEQWITTSKTDPNILARAEQVKAEIERDAATKRNAIAAVLGATASSTTSAAATSKPAARQAKQA